MEHLQYSDVFLRHLYCVAKKISRKSEDQRQQVGAFMVLSKDLDYHHHMMPSLKGFSDPSNETAVEVTLSMLDITPGYNLTPSVNGESYPYTTIEGRSQPYVMHAEEVAMNGGISLYKPQQSPRLSMLDFPAQRNALGKLFPYTMVVTHCPCVRCMARIVFNSLIERVIFFKPHDYNESVGYLKSIGSNIEVIDAGHLVTDLI